MQSERIVAIDRQLEMLRARRAQIVSRVTKGQRRIRTRQAIIIGTWLMVNNPDLLEEIKRQLIRPQDRKAFGLDEGSVSGAVTEGGRDA